MSLGRGAGIAVVALVAGVAAFSATIQAQEGPQVDVARLLGQGGAHLGVVLADVDKDAAARLKLADERGALIKEVRSGSAAEKAGLKEGDVITRYHGELVQSVAQFTRLVRESPPGRSVSLEIVRNGVPQKVTATLGRGRRDFHFDFDLPDLDAPEPPEAPEASQAPEPPRPPRLRMRGLLPDGGGRGLLLDRGPRKLGIEYQEIGGQLGQYFKLPEGRGILVSNVDESGPAGKAGLKAGDVILKLEGKAVRDSRDFRDEVARAKPGDEVTLTVQRDGKPLDVKVKLGGNEDRIRARETT